MNKKEVAEIKKLVSKDNCRLDRICTCYVDGHKQKISSMREAYLSIPEEEMFKYSEIFKKTLSGTIGKNLLNLDFPLAEEEGGRQTALLRLRDSELKDPELVDRFFDQFIDTYLYAENYLMLLVHGSYDIPAKTTDQNDLFDASDYVYSFLLFSVCPVSLSKEGLCYDAASNSFIDKAQDWMVQKPEAGFLFPAFNDRNTDIHSLLYYTKNPEVLHPELTQDMLGVQLPLAAGDQKDTFNTVIEETFGEDCNFDLAKTVHAHLNAMLEGKKEDPEPAWLDKPSLKNFLAGCGADEEQLAHFEQTFPDDKPEEDRFLASNVASTRRFEVKSPDVRISVSPERTDLLETRTIDGRQCLAIPLTDDVEVNGIRIRTVEKSTQDEKNTTV